MSGGETHGRGGDRGHGGTVAAGALREAGVDTVFAVPGGHVLHLLDGCLDAGIRVVDTRHEGAAALAAEGWALASGRPGVAVVTAGPGFANALIGLMDAGVWSVPLVLVGGRTGLDRVGRGAVMDVDQAAVAAPVAKRVVRCVDPARIAACVHEAVYTARAGRPGPVYLEIPMDVYGADARDGRAPTEGYPQRPPVPAGAPQDVDRALALLEEAERPAIIAGGGAFWAEAGDELARLAETAGIPVTTTSAARGVVPDSHPWSLGGMIHAGAALLQSDVVLVLGSAFNANLAFGRPPLLGPDQRVVQVDLAPDRVGGNRRPDVAIAGDVREVCRALADAWRKPPDTRAAWRDQALEVCGHMRSTWDRQVDGHRGRRLHAGAVVRELAATVRDAVGPAVTFVCDGGDAVSWGIAYTYAEGPGRLLTTTTALGSLGVGMPFALAAAAARPDEPVIVFTGDGSFGLSAMEVDTAARHGLPVVVVVSNNGGWGDVSHEQDSWFGPGRHVASELADTRYDRLGEALGAHGERVTDLEDLGPAVRRALDAGGPAVIDVTTDPEVLSDLLRNVGDLGLM